MVGAILKTFGRVSASTRPVPPSWVMEIETPAFLASCHVASTPVPSVTIETAPASIARLAFWTAVRAERWLS